MISIGIKSPDNSLIDGGNTVKDVYNKYILQI